MTGVLDGIKVLDLSWGVAGPVATMLLADHGAAVTKIDPPDGDPFEGLSGYRVWQRGKRRAQFDLHDPGDHETFMALVDHADVLVESFSPGTTEQLGIDDATLRARNPRLITCSITGYGSTGADADRPAYDALVGARTGHQWEHRGVVGGTLQRLSGGPGMMPGLEAEDPGCWSGAPRQGPLFGGVPWISMATAYQANLAINAALHVREQTGVGQAVATSMMQGVLATTGAAWQRTAAYEAPGYESWIIDPRTPKGFFRAADGKWIHQWAILPSFVLGAAEGDELAVPDPDDDSTWQVASPRASDMRIGLGPDEMTLLHHFNPLMAEAVAKFPADEWTRFAAHMGAPMQIVRSPEEALLDETLVTDGCVIEVDDAQLGAVRQVGSVLRLSACPTSTPTAAAAPGAHTDAVRAEAAASGAPAGPLGAAPTTPFPSAPLAGVRVLDLGLAIAGPWSTQLLADLGADVIKVNALTDGYWFGTHLAMLCNRGKRSIALNLKDAEAMAALHRLVESADIVQHNLRYDAAERLGIDYESLKKIKPDLIYCHTRGFEHGPRSSLPGNDQTGSALAGAEWLDGGLDNDGVPVWSLSSLGDTGNGFLAAIGMVQALSHRTRTGEGQFVDTSILYAHLLNVSSAWITPDGETKGDRQQLDAMQLGWSALYRLYETSDGWVCVAAITQAHWDGLTQAIELPHLADDPRFATAQYRRDNDAELQAELETAFGARSATAWFAALDQGGVPCEVSNPDFVLGLYDDQDMIDKGWVTSTEHATMGRIDTSGLLFDLERTPGIVQRAAPAVGQHTTEILGDVGYSPTEIEALIAAGGALAYAPAGPPQ